MTRDCRSILSKLALAISIRKSTDRVSGRASDSPREGNAAVPSANNPACKAE